MGGINDIITRIVDDEGKCELYTKSDNAFDYERQRELNFQVKAQDTLQTMNEALHDVYAQIHIEVLDVNDETPELYMVRII